MKRIGLLARMSWEFSAEYNQATRDRLGGLHSADCLLRSVDFAEIEQLQRDGNWDEAGRRLAREAAALQASRGRVSRLPPWRTSSPTPDKSNSAASDVSLARVGLRIIWAMQSSGRPWHDGCGRGRLSGKG